MRCRDRYASHNNNTSTTVCHSHLLSCICIVCSPNILCIVLVCRSFCRYQGFWWSPCGTMIAYTEVDETAVPAFDILHQGKADPRHVESHRYPFAGQANPSVRLAVVVVPAAGATPTTVWMDLCGADSGTVSDIDPNDYYLARAGWWPDGSVMAQVQNRRQTVLQLLRLDPLTGARQVLVEERTEVWVNLHDMLHSLPTLLRGDSSNCTGAVGTTGRAGFRFIWASERSGYRQLYLYQYDCASSSSNSSGSSGSNGGTGARGVAEVLLQVMPIGGGGSWIVER